MGRKDEAEIQTEKMLSKNPESALLWYQKAVNSINRGDIDTARESVTTALRINPEMEEAQNLLLKLINKNQKHILSSCR